MCTKSQPAGHGPSAYIIRGGNRTTFLYATQNDKMGLVNLKGDEDMTIRTLMENEIEKWIDFVWGIFPYEPRGLFERQWYQDPYRDIRGIIVAVDDENQILSTLRIFFRDINLNGSRVKSGGIGSVGTLEAYRGKGLSSQLFKVAIGLMEAEDVKISFLLSGTQNEGYYNSHGYYKSKLEYRTSEISKVVDYPTPYHIRAVNMNQDLADLMKMHGNFSAKYNGNVARNEAYWKKWFTALSGQTKIAESQTGEVIAYLHISDSKESLEVCEFGTMSGFEDIFDSFINKICVERNPTNNTVFFASAIHSALPVVEKTEACLCMYRLNKPFELNGSEIIDTEQLIAAIKGDKSESKMLLWMTDDV